MRPTGDAIAVGVLAGLLLFVAVNLQAGWVYAVDAVLLGLLGVGCVSSWMSTRGITVAREMPREAVQGEPLRMILEVRTRRWSRHYVELRESAAVLAAGPHVIPVLSPRHPVRIVCDAIPRRRGLHRLDGFEVYSAGLTGLFAARTRVPASAELVVFPRYWILPDLPAPVGAAEEHAATPQTRRDGSEVAGVRDFRDGDTMRHVHWRSTARRGAVVVKEFAWQRNEAPVVLLDTRAAVHAGHGDDNTFEDLARAAATIAQFITRDGRPVQIITSGGAGRRAVAGWRQALHLLAGLQTEDGLPPLEQYVAAVPPGTPAAVISPDADGVAALAQHGAPMIAVLLDHQSYSDPPQPHPLPQGIGGEGKGDGGLMLLHALGVPVAVLRRGEEVGACLRSWVP